jgi:hypothetical protein
MGSPVTTIFVRHGKDAAGTVLCRGGRCSAAVAINRPLTIGSRQRCCISPENTKRSTRKPPGNKRQ